MADTYHEFDDQKVSEAIATAHAAHMELTGAPPTETAEAAAAVNLSGADGALEVAAQCITVTVANKKVCVKLPLGIGQICLPVPGFVPNGQAAQACISICTTWGIPTGVRLTVSVGGNVILRKTFGKC
jgi:hypothetical protein